MITKDSLKCLKKVEIAYLLDKTERTIFNLDQEGLPGTGEGRGRTYVWSEVLAWWLDRISGSREGAEATSKARKESAEADLAEMKRDALQGTLLEVEDVRATWADALARVRAKLLAIPSKAAVRMEDGQALAVREEIIRDMVHEALAELVEQIGGQDA